jgi:hypothetical protein
MKHALIGCINKLMPMKGIETRFFHVSVEKGKVRDVTENLVEAIDKFNESASMKRKLGIPYEYKNGVACYSYGCGLSHYLQMDLFKDIQEVSEDILEFPIGECFLSMYTPADIENILECKGVFSKNIKVSLKEHYAKQ